MAHPEPDLVQQSVQADPEARLDALRRLRALHREHGDEVDVFCAHDPWEFQRYAR